VAGRDDAVLHLMGSDRIWELFRGLPPAKKRRFLPGDMDAYYDFLAGLDVGIAPLEDTGFNRCRSDVKFLEYAFSSVTAVMKRLAPYEGTIEHGVTGFLFDDSNELVAILDDLVSDGAKRRVVAERARAYVATERTERGHAAQRLDLYRSLMARTPSDAALRFDRLCRRAGATPEGRHVTLEHGAYETLVLQALARGQLEGHSAEALSCLERASELEPSAYQPLLFGANFSPDPVARLSASLQKNPESVGARTLLAEHLARSGKLERAVAMLLEATEMCPAYDVPYLAAVRVLRDAGHEQEAKELAQIALSLRRPLIELYAG
jgi:tetratricopeptide (TPR) repeat protein